MKKIFSILMLAVLLVSALGFSAKPASAAGLISYMDGLFVWGKGVVFVFEASGYRNKDLKGADIFVGSNFHDLGCTVSGTKIVCTADSALTRYAGQTGVIYLAGQIFYVTIPGRFTPVEESTESETLVCDKLEMMGAWVLFELFDGEDYDLRFVEGTSLEDVEEKAASKVNNDPITNYTVVSDFGCYEESEPQES